jgi:hypothetical protein
VATLLIAATTVRAGVVYDNTEAQLNYVLTFTNNQEIGDQIWLAHNQTYPYLTNFSLEYYSTNTSFHGDVQADVRFHLNDGPLTNGYASPGTVFYDSDWLDVQPPQSYFPGTNSAVLNFTWEDLQSGAVPMNSSMVLPTNFTVSVTFRGLAGSDIVGFDYMGLNDFDPPAVGTNYGDFWFNNGGHWTLKSYGSLPVAFAMRLDASSMPGGPILHIDHFDDQAVVWWSPLISGWTLQTNSNLATSNWNNYQGTIVNNRATNSAPRGTVFFRLAKGGGGPSTNYSVPFIEDFEGGTLASTRFVAVSGSPSVSGTSPISGSYSLVVNNGDNARCTFSPAQADCYVFFLIKVASAPSSSGYIFYLQDAVGNNLGRVGLADSGTTLRFYDNLGNHVDSLFDPTSENIRVWLEYHSGGNLVVYTSNNNTKPGSPDGTLAGGGSTSGAALTIANSIGGSVKFDHVAVSSTQMSGVP